MSGRFGRLAHDEVDYGYLQRGNATEKRRTKERLDMFNGKQGAGRRKFTTPVSAKDASASAGLDLRYDATDDKPWCVVVWPQGYEKRFAVKQDAYDYIKAIDKDEFWAPGKGANHERERVR